jgi:hypothetical protein
VRNHYAGPGNVLLTFATPILQRVFENADALNQALVTIYHYVNPFRGTGERISIAFNINLRFGD